MVQQLPLEDIINNIVRSLDKPLAIDSFLELLDNESPSGRPNQIEIQMRHLDENTNLFLDFSEEVVVPRWYFFNNAHFRIMPTAEEIESGILFAGHRFFPFVSSDVFPPKCRLKTMSGRQIRRKQVVRKIAEIEIYFSLFSFEDITMFLTVENEDNKVALQADNVESALVKLTAYNMKNFYADHNFKPGDSLVLTVKDWDKGEFEVEYNSTTEVDRNFSYIRKWCINLEDALESVFEANGPIGDVNEQLARAFFLGGQELVERPGLHVGGFLAQNNNIEISHVGGVTLLWRQGENPDDLIYSSAATQSIQLLGTTESLDAIMQDVGLSLAEGELKAFMKNELFSGGGDLDAVLKACLTGRAEVQFYDNEQQEIFHQLIEKLWAEVRADYDLQKDQAIGPLRRETLAAYRYHLEWLRSLDARGIHPDELPVAKMLELAQFAGVISTLLTSLDTPDFDADTGDEDLEFFDNIDQVLHSMITEIEQELTGA